MKDHSSQPDVKQIIDDVLDLYSGLLVPYMQVQRDLPFPGDSTRAENDGEHAFTLAIVAITLAQKMNIALDYGKVAQYSLIHDLVEAHAGDVSAKSSEQEQMIKIDREREAMLTIQERYKQKAPWIPELIEKYERRQEPEAIFVYAVDKQMGGYTWLAGGGKAWFKTYPEPDGSTFHKVIKRLRKKAKIYPDLLPLFDSVHERLDKERLNFK